MILYAASIFVSAFLLFLVEPILGKYILPWFGGGPTVWTTCLLFFQVLLLCGYAYSHFLSTRLTPRRQGWVHFFLLATTIAFLPITPAEKWRPLVASVPTWQILGLLSVSVGACFFLLSSTAPLLQFWFSRTWPDSSPYKLYALSNIGSLAAIGSYPFLIEPTLGLGLQTRVWSYGYVIFAVLCASCGFRLMRRGLAERNALSPETTTNASDPIRAVPTAAERVLWLVLPALSSVLLLATTNQMCLDAAPIPLL